MQKNPNKNYLVNQQHIFKNTFDQVNLTQESKDSSTLKNFNGKHHINRLKEKNQMLYLN